MARVMTVILLAGAMALADGPGDNLPDKVRQIPPPGIKLTDDDKKDLETRLEALGREVAALAVELKAKPAMLALLPDVEVFHKAVRYALENNEFYTAAEIKLAHGLLLLGHARAKQLREGKPTFTTDTGLVVRGYRSRIDGSVQPYGLIVPAPVAGKRRLDVWLHGRYEKVSEVTFLGQRLKNKGEFTPPGAIVLHPFGRYSNAFKFAGEIDVLEAIEHVKANYAIDDDRIVMRGFSMGGAGCWQFAVHYPSMWAAAAPGAGFSETPRFLDVFQKEKVEPTSYEKLLWRLYDCDGYAANLAMLPTVAYSGEKDRQKQAADVMEEALRKANIELVHIIGAGAGHSYTPAARREIDRRIDRLASLGRPRVPQTVNFTTFTLRYNQSYWVRLDELGRHWEQATITASASSVQVMVRTTNVERFTLSFGPGDSPLLPGRKIRVMIDDTGKNAFYGPLVRSDNSWSASFEKEGGAWKLAEKAPEGVRKVHGLQGPIDDAFMDSFLMVRPTGKGWHEKPSAWAKSEMTRAVDQWRRQFRGDARVKDDKDVTAEDIASHNLILWGDPSSNSLIEKVLPKLPVGWDEKSVRVGKQLFASEWHAPILICPNPLNPKRYVVLNSGFTFREYDQLNNARQVPKLPDYAVIDVRTPPSSRRPGRVALADFFDERWRVAE